MQIRMEDLTIDTLVEASLTERKSRRFTCFSIVDPTLAVLVNFKQGSRFACMSLRRFRELINYAGIQYVEKTTPMFNMPAAFDD